MCIAGAVLEGRGFRPNFLVIIPKVVADELHAATDINIQNICTLEWIQIVVKPVMDSLMEKAGFRVSIQLYNRVLILSDE